MFVLYYAFTPAPDRGVPRKENHKYMKRMKIPVSEKFDPARFRDPHPDVEPNGYYASGLSFLAEKLDGERYQKRITLLREAPINVRLSVALGIADDVGERLVLMYARGDTLDTFIERLDDDLNFLRALLPDVLTRWGTLDKPYPLSHLVIHISEPSARPLK